YVILLDYFDDDNIDIELGPRIRISSRSRQRPTAETAAAKYVWGGIDNSSVCIHLSAMKDILEHAVSFKDREVGGVLLGYECCNQPVGSIDLRQAIKASHTIENRASLTFTHQTWLDLDRVIKQNKMNCEILGWYHSHPSFGIFLSEYDQFIHRHFFSGASQVAMVVDPVEKTVGLFTWDNGILRPVKGITIYASTKDSCSQIRSVIADWFWVGSGKLTTREEG
ncbi:MAG: Mov34/MPN/PAD-1 family protein, partial [Chitinophagales bacterium]